MAPVLTLHRATDPPTLPEGLAEHPIETARRALLEAAAIEWPYLARALRLAAESLPERRPIPKSSRT
jgi:hypothetical protein